MENNKPDLRKRCLKCKLVLSDNSIHITADTCIRALQKSLTLAAAIVKEMSDEGREARGLRAIVFVLAKKNGGTLKVSHQEMGDVSSTAEMSTENRNDGIVITVSEPKPVSPIIQ